MLVLLLLRVLPVLSILGQHYNRQDGLVCPNQGQILVWRDLVMVCWSLWEEADWYEPLNMEPIVCLK